MRKEFLIRHGQSEGNVDTSIYYEKMDCDIELTDVGMNDARNVAQKIQNLSEEIRYWSVYFSPYKRAVDTKDVIVEMLNFDNKVCEQRMIPQMRERDFGGLRDIMKDRALTDDHFNFFFRPPSGESLADCYDRSCFVADHLDRGKNYGNRILVAHGEWIKTYLMYRLGWSIEEFDNYKNPKNCEVILIEYDDNRWYISPLTPLRTRNKTTAKI